MHYTDAAIDYRAAIRQDRASAQRPPIIRQTFAQMLTALAGASGLVLLVPFAILLVGVPLVLLVRGAAEALEWVFRLVFL